MSLDNIEVTVKTEMAGFHPAISEKIPVAILVTMKRRVKKGEKAKDGFEATVRVPIGEPISSVEFAKGVKALFLASQAFHHRVYDKLREELDALNQGMEKSPAIFEKDQRGS
jgi:hypothetical protein